MRNRSGFTLIELMVAMALILFIMVILAQAFTASLDTFRHLKAIGDMQSNLRSAEVILRHDLAQDHFTGKRRLSDPNFTDPNFPIKDGFFAVRRLGPPIPEGTDAFGMPSFRATDQLIYMSVKQKGNRQENFYNTALIAANPAVTDTFFAQVTAPNMAPIDLANSTWAPPYTPNSGFGIYASQWAEVLYYLKRAGTTAAPTDPTSILGTPTYSLYRAQWVMVPDSTNVSGKIPNTVGGVDTDITTFNGMSCNKGPGGMLTFYSPTDAALGDRVISNLAPAAFDSETSVRLLKLDTNGAVIRETLVLPNVVSFHVQIMPNTTPGVFVDVPPTGVASPWGVYDTTKFNPAGAAAGYGQFGIKAIQVTLRVWDGTTQQTRQITIVQDL